MNAKLDTTNLTISIDGTVVFTAPVGHAPAAQLAGELDELCDAGTIDRATRKALAAELWASEIGRGATQTKAWQFSGAL